MAIAVNVTGPALVRTGTGTANALEDLGFSINGIQLIETVFESDVPGDQNGGEEGPPIDIQYFGQIDRIRMEFSKYDELVVDKIRARLRGGTAGIIGTAGTLIAGTSVFYRLLITPTNTPRNYVAAIPREPIEVNRGTKYSRLIMEWECHGFNGTLWNTVIT